MSLPIKGDPFHESELLVAIQHTLADVPGVCLTAKAMSLFGEHGAGWLASTGIGWAVTRGATRQKWAAAGVAVFGSHAASVVLKRIVRRPRPHDPRIVIGVGTPSTLSFPSSHATSTTAALVAIARITGSTVPLLGVPAIMLSRLVLGVHYPSDVAFGAALGATSAIAAEKICTR